ncbi:starch synthase, partial [Burkholderia sp. SIMBA_013]
MQRNAMTADFSWRPAVAQYLALFHALSGTQAQASAPARQPAQAAARPVRRAHQGASLTAPLPQ